MFIFSDDALQAFSTRSNKLLTSGKNGLKYMVERNNTEILTKQMISQEAACRLLISVS